MKLSSKFFAFALLFNGLANLSFAQDTNIDNHDITITVPEVALLDIEPSANNSISVGPTAPTEAGAPIDYSNANDNSLWLNYSSIIGSTTEDSRKVTVSITSGTIPGGMILKLVAGADAGNGEGTVGTPTAEITLTTLDQDLVTGVKSCYTNTPENNGHQLTYTLEAESGSYGDLDFDDDASQLTVTYTLSDQ